MPRVLVTDWDETVTVKDTTLLVAQAAYRHKKGLPEFSNFTKIYLEAYAKFNEKNNGIRNTVAKEIEFQQCMKAVEMTSISAIEECSIFEGLTLLQFAELAGEVQIRPHFMAFARNITSAGVPVYILSVNWSRTLIEATLALHGVSGVKVLANDFQVHEGYTTGVFDGIDIRTGFDKSVKLREIKECHKHLDVVYVGDSLGDVLPLIEADVGIVITGGRATELVENFGSPVELLQSSMQSLKGGVYGGDWEEIATAWEK